MMISAILSIIAECVGFLVIDHFKDATPNYWVDIGVFIIIGTLNFAVSFVSPWEIQGRQDGQVKFVYENVMTFIAIWWIIFVRFSHELTDNLVYVLLILGFTALYWIRARKITKNPSNGILLMLFETAIAVAWIIFAGGFLTQTLRMADQLVVTVYGIVGGCVVIIVTQSILKQPLIAENH